MNIRFDGKTVAISGAAIGFGQRIATTFAALGATVYGCDILPASTATSAFTLDRVDLTDRPAATRWIGDVEARCGGAIDILINNAGGVAGESEKPIELVDDAQWDKVVEINLGATFALCRAAAPAMKRAGAGAIVNISSGAALHASLTGVQAYCAAKHAVLGLTRQLAHELGPFGVRTNSVAPGFVQTNEATARQWAGYSPEKQAALIQSIALKRLGTADEIAKVTVFLASDLASFVNGQIISVDGGR